MSRAWWLGLSERELKQAETCNRCGQGGADISRGICFDCFQADRQKERARAYWKEREKEYYAEKERDHRREQRKKAGLNPDPDHSDSEGEGG